MIVTGDKALLFEPQAADTRKFLEVVLQHMQARSGGAVAGSTFAPDPHLNATASHNEYMNRCGV